MGTPWVPLSAHFSLVPGMILTISSAIVFYKQSILGRMRECEFCTYVRRLANQMNAMFHGSINRSPWYIHLD